LQAFPLEHPPSFEECKDETENFQMQAPERFLCISMIHMSASSPRATTKCLGEQPDHDGDDAYDEDYTCPDTGFENVANQFTARERK
jgi:hypothetical protein